MQSTHARTPREVSAFAKHERLCRPYRQMAATPAKAAHAAAGGKREGSDSKRTMTLSWWRRCALAAAFLACFAEAAPLPLPANPATACGPAVTTAWSQEYPSCPRAMLGNSVIYNSPEIDPGTRTSLTTSLADKPQSALLHCMRACRKGAASSIYHASTALAKSIRRSNVPQMMNAVPEL